MMEAWARETGDVEALVAVKSRNLSLAYHFLQIAEVYREAQAGGCTNDLWLALAAAREKDQPENALPIYQRQIEPLVNQKDNQAYAQAARYVGKLCKLFRRLQREAEFTTYLANMRKAHKPKRNFMALLDQMK